MKTEHDQAAQSQQAMKENTLGQSNESDSSTKPRRQNDEVPCHVQNEQTPIVELKQPKNIVFVPRLPISDKADER